MLQLLGVWGRQAEDPADVQEDEERVVVHHGEDWHGGVEHTSLFLTN